MTQRTGPFRFRSNLELRVDNNPTFQDISNDIVVRFCSAELRLPYKLTQPIRLLLFSLLLLVNIIHVLNLLVILSRSVVVPAVVAVANHNATVNATAPPWPSGQGVHLECWRPAAQILKLVVRGFPRVLRFPPILHRLMVSANKIKQK